MTDTQEAGQIRFAHVDGRTRVVRLCEKYASGWLVLDLERGREVWVSRSGVREQVQLTIGPMGAGRWQTKSA